MRPQRRVDWPLIIHAGDPLPVVRGGGGGEAARSDVCELAVAFQELASFAEVDAMLRRAVELARQSIGVERAAIFLIDHSTRLVKGTWGTNLQCRTVDERHVMWEYSEDARAAFRRAAEGEPWTLVENCPIVEHLDHETRVCGRSWVACTPIFSARRAIGMMFNDAGWSDTPIDEERQGMLAILCSFLGVLLDVPAVSNGHAAAFRRTSALVSAVVQELASAPELSGATLARKHGTSVSRLARVFKAEMGMSIVEHRNRLRLERFFRLVEAGHGLLPAALEAGFGSYAQFHRVFRARHKSSPAVYLGRRERGSIRPPAR
jgi:AraC-like DNA-binding protein